MLNSNNSNKWLTNSRVWILEISNSKTNKIGNRETQEIYLQFLKDSSIMILIETKCQATNIINNNRWSMVMLISSSNQTNNFKIRNQECSNSQLINLILKWLANFLINSNFLINNNLLTIWKGWDMSLKIKWELIKEWHKWCSSRIRINQDFKDNMANNNSLNSKITSSKWTKDVKNVMMSNHPFTSLANIRSVENVASEKKMSSF